MKNGLRYWILFLLAVTCSACGGSGSSRSDAPPQYLPQSLRGQTFQTMTAAYLTGVSPTTSAISDLSPSTQIAVSTNGDSFTVSGTQVLDNGTTWTIPSQKFNIPVQGTTSSQGNGGGTFIFPAAATSLSYMSYGEWTTPQSGFVQHFAYGSPTSGPGIPTTGNATYNGAFQGSYFTQGFLASITHVDGSLTAAADFSARSVSLNAIATSPADPTYNFTGTMSYAAGVNALSGSVSNSNFVAGGDTRARFFGPSAAELGGVFRFFSQSCDFLGCSTSIYAGAYGAKR